MTRVLECANCGRRTFYEKQRCLDCESDQFDERDPGTGELVSITRVYVTPDGVREPNRLGLARFKHGANLIAQFDGDLSVGDAVSLSVDSELRDVEGDVHIGPRLVPADD